MTAPLALDLPVVSVSDLNRRVRTLLENQFEMVWVAGELSNVKLAASGHWYFCLKDPTAQVECAMFRARARFLDFRPEEGQKVEVRARVTLYEQRGNYQLVVEEIRMAGLGSLYEAFEKLKAKLQAEGLFDAQRKKPVPLFPRAIGLVTSPQAAALRDVLTTLRRRSPGIPVIVYPTPVQGEGAGARIARAIESANRREECDVLVVCRGGGSLEDLWAYNEEAVARAIAASRLPVVSGVGHETDFTIADFVADLRAATPTAAAVAVAPDRAALCEELAAFRRRISRDMRRIVEIESQRLDGAAARLARGLRQVLQERSRRLERAASRLLTPAQRLARDRECVAQLHRRLQRALPDLADARHAHARLFDRLRVAFRRRDEQRRMRIAGLRNALGHLDPTQVLARGYSIVRDPRGHVVRSGASLAAGDAIDVTFSEGGAEARVLKTR